MSSYSCVIIVWEPFNCVEIGDKMYSRRQSVGKVLINSYFFPILLVLYLLKLSVANAINNDGVGLGLSNSCFYPYEILIDVQKYEGEDRKTC